MELFSRRQFLHSASIASVVTLISRTDALVFSSSISKRSDAVEPGFIMWSPHEFDCPICKTKNTFMVWDSYGSYIYQYPSKYQLVFWPYTDSQSWYSCKKCRLSIFMAEFDKIPAEKIPDLHKMLDTTSLPAPKERSAGSNMWQPPYLEIPTSARLAVAEKVYQALGKSDDDFWNHFYRVMGYHYDAESKQSEADNARQRSISLTERLLADKTREGQRKEFLYILGAMRHFTRDDIGALRAFEEASKLKFSNKDLKAEQNKNYNEYLSVLLKEYTEMIKKGDGPRQDRN